MAKQSAVEDAIRLTSQSMEESTALATESAVEAAVEAARFEANASSTEALRELESEYLKKIANLEEKLEDAAHLRREIECYRLKI